ncbi:PREDICTED: uncharacterized protein LOC108778124 [Cyphomyrmex costatus]|uniref:uncharacterized protein LOC108778124 n=1 Tax=Cyphomyrmex costatus TaxID=456900 RepID=UPI00085231D5|nr:PREDICTED: uncharacterized protein LOC108778124 [Cyphomyrmex costatus]
MTVNGRPEHMRNMHAGVQATMAFVRQRFWPISLRSTVRKIIQGCITCFRAKPVSSKAMMGSLPPARVRVSKLFSHCGVDYAGPVLLREGAQKIIKELYDVFNKQEKQDGIKRFLGEQKIHWSFIPLNAPHFGGLWEAGVKSVKHHLTRVVGEAHLTYEEMQTVLCDRDDPQFATPHAFEQRSQ